MCQLIKCAGDGLWPHTRLDYGENYGGLDTPEYRAMNPHGKIPVVTVGDDALFETSAILRYLAGLHGSEAFWPSDPMARAQVDMWADWAKNDVAEGFTWPVFWRVVRTPKPRLGSRGDPGGGGQAGA